MEVFVLALAATISAWGFGWCLEREGMRGAWGYGLGTLGTLAVLAVFVFFRRRVMADPQTTPEGKGDGMTDDLTNLVKPLVWRECLDGNHRKGECYTTRSPVSFSPIAVHKKHDGWWLNVDCETYPDLASAEAAANADHAARVLDAIDVDALTALQAERDALKATVATLNDLDAISVDAVCRLTAERDALKARAENPQGFTAELKKICRDTCAEFGDPPCWKLPELVQPCEKITPCAECLAAMKGGQA